MSKNEAAEAYRNSWLFTVLQFQTKILAKLFIKKQSIIATTAFLKYNKIAVDKTPLQRKIVSYTLHDSSHRHLVFKVQPAISARP